MWIRMSAAAAVVLASMALSCGGGEGGPPAPVPTVDPALTPASFSVTTEAFATAGEFPERFSCLGPDGGVSPPVTWSGAPEGTRAYIVILSEPDSPVGDVYHWVLSNLPSSVTSLSEGAGSATESRGGSHVRNSFNIRGYTPPCTAVTPRDRTLRLEVIALNGEVQLLGSPERADIAQLLIAVDGHVLGRGVAEFTYNE